jgi:imidazolonepropionase-like amidohydrolase
MHGPTIQHEIELWVAGGIPAEVALEAATLNSAKLLKADSRFGSVEKGKEATLLIVDGNPLQDVKALSTVSAVFMKGERVNRTALLQEH